MTYWCGCCATLQPRYRRLVDSIYPSIPGDGLVKSNMQKLTFYAVSHPEKLDRIGAYLTHRLGRDIYRQRMGFIRVAVEAMNQLLAACRASPSLNLYVESFLKMVHRLLETALPELELMATESFVNFAYTEEDAPSYHRRYDFFICKFSSLCHNSAADLTVRQKLRSAGISSLRGLVRKTATDDLQANLWEKQHMDKIVPSLLFNIHDPFSVSCSQTSSSEGPATLAEHCLRELIGKASFGNIRCVLNPAFSHFDQHNLWTCDPFSVNAFETIMHSVQSQYSYVVIQSLIGHLDKHGNDSAVVRCGIATVLSRIVVIAATASIGPSLLEIFNSVLRHLRQSVELQSHDGHSQVDKDKSERAYQDILINAIGNFADNLPDYQKAEIMVFIINKVPLDTDVRLSDKFLQKVLTRTLLQVATKYKTGYLGTVLTSTFLEPLLKLSLVNEAHVRLLVQRILHTLVDRHRNLQPLLDVTEKGNASFLENFDPAKFVVEKFSRADAMFVQKFGDSLLLTLYESSMMANNEQENFDAIFITMSLLFMEIGCELVVLDLFRLALALQELAQDKLTALSYYHKIHLKQLVAKYVFVVSTILSIPSLSRQCERLLRECSDVDVPDACPGESALNADVNDVFVLEPEASDLLIDKDAVDRQIGNAPWVDKEELAESLKLRDYDVTRLNEPFTPSKAKPFKPSIKSNGSSSKSSAIESTHSHSSRMGRGLSKRMEAVLEHDGTVFPSNVDGLRQVLAHATETWAMKEQEKGRRTVNMFKTLPFSTLIEIQRQNRSQLNSTVERLFKSAADPSISKQSPTVKLQFPQLYVH